MNLIYSLFLYSNMFTIVPKVGDATFTNCTLEISDTTLVIAYICDNHKQVSTFEIEDSSAKHFRIVDESKNMIIVVNIFDQEMEGYLGSTCWFHQKDGLATKLMYSGNLVKL
uniref:Uncharacterized protein n=1 Tax=Clandestinovirus TaxID=2831644 RepID=A0A8F8KKV5_9VIRU|nr:hypothetical protein KOM_12_269 [Clandestinovirus]